MTGSRTFLSLGYALLLGFNAGLYAQVPQPAPGQIDPLMQMMLSQPRIETEGEVVAVSSFEPPSVRPGERTIYRVVFNALEDSVDWPEKVPAPSQLTLRPGAHGQVLQMSFTNMQPKTTFIYHAQPSKEGQFIVPEFTVTVYGRPVQVPAALLEVSADAPRSPASSPPLILEFPATTLYVGQAVRARVLMPAGVGGVIQFLGQVQLNGSGLILDQSTATQRVEPVQRGGGIVTSVIYEVTMTPITAGQMPVYAQGYSMGSRFFAGGGSITITGPVVLPGGPPQYTLLDSDPVTLNIKPLPSEGKLPGFTGAVGNYIVDTPTLGTNVVRVGEPLKLSVKVRGEVNLARLVPPPPPRVPDWQVFAVTEPMLPQLVNAQGFATFNFNLVPLTEETRQTPAIPFSCFDPGEGKYRDLTIAPVALTVLPGTVPTDTQVLAQAEELAKSGEKELVLSDLALAPGRASSSLAPVQQRSWFPVAALAPALAFGVLLTWDRRRRYLEDHPDVVLRRRARRALRRQRRALRKAAATGQPARVAVAAVSAFRVACAPYYPAEPRALVGSDVLPLLPEWERSGRPGELVRRCFEVADAAQFSQEPSDGVALAKAAPEIDLVLEQFERELAR